MDNLQYERMEVILKNVIAGGFKPYYKWIIFNITSVVYYENSQFGVLNLIING